MNETLQYDSVVIGSGQGGNPLAVQLAARGERVALIERSFLGGTCINTGCTPTKIYVASAQVAHYSRESARWGVRAGSVTVDLAGIRRRKDEYIQGSRASWQRKIDANQTLQLHHGVARFVAPGEVEVSGQRIRGKKMFIDTGTNSIVPPIEGLSEIPYLTNETLLELSEVPQHLIVLGGGYIGLEFSQIFRRFGSNVTVIANGERLLGREDDDVADALKQALEAEGIRFEMNMNITRVSRVDGEIELSTGDGRRARGSHLLLAVGREPNTRELKLENAGVKTDKRGYIQVNDKLETTAESTWALGDVKGGPAFTHISYNDYQIIWANLFEGRECLVSQRMVPYAVFTDPQLGRIGMTEREAVESGKKIKKGSIPMSQVARANERLETAGFMKIIVDAENDHILGASILGVEGGETVQILGTLMLANQPYTVLKGAIYIHPTLAEGLFTLLDSVK